MTLRARTKVENIEIDSSPRTVQLVYNTAEEELENPYNVNKYGFKDEEIINAAKLKPTLTNDSDLDRQVADLIDKVTSDTMSNYEKVLAVYLYIESSFSYRSSYIPSSNKYVSRNDELVVGRAKGIIETGHGTCTEFAALFTVAMRALGFEAYSVSGWYGGGQHTWTVMVFDGEKYIFDTEIDFRYMQYKGKTLLYHFMMDDTFKDYRYYHAANESRDIAAYNDFALEVTLENPEAARVTYEEN